MVRLNPIPDGRRGQLVLVAAAVVAVALAPVLLAYLQLGYHPDVDREPAIAGEDAVAFLDRSVHAAAAATAGEHDWNDRAAMADAVRVELSEDLDSLETSTLADGVAHGVAYNHTAGVDWVETGCETGAGKRFGDCEVDDGVVLQERAGEAVLLAVAFDVRIIGPDGQTELVVVVEVGG